jgi:tRNA pseudouridine55 synthase
MALTPSSSSSQPEGILLVDKPEKMLSFKLIQILRKKLNVKKIGHAGTLDPFATGVMVLLIGKAFTRLSDSFLHHDKAYEACIKLGAATDTYDWEGKITQTSDYIPKDGEIEQVIAKYQGNLLQVPPMFSAKKVAGKKLYELARKGEEIERKACPVQVKTELLSYDYPLLRFKVACTKGTYIRSLAHDIGTDLKCFGHLVELRRTKSGPFTLKNCLDGKLLQEMPAEQICEHLLSYI